MSTSSDRVSVTQSAESPASAGIQFRFDGELKFGVPFEVADGIWWIKLPIDSSLEWVNVYCLKDGNGLTLIDAGWNESASQQALESALASSQLSNLRLTRIIVTHFHPDHIGLAGELARRYRASLWMTRTCWLSCKLLKKTASEFPAEIELQFMQQAGLIGIELEAFKRQPANRYDKLVTELPEQYMPLVDGQNLEIGPRTWGVVVGNGHASEHLTLWSQDVAIVGDQILPSVSVNLTVPVTEPEIDLIAEWKNSCLKLSQIANNQILCLPGHQRPFTGVRNRLGQIQANIESALQRLSKLITRPSSALECLEPFHNRLVPTDQRRTLLPELVGFLNHLRSRGEADRKINADGVAIYHRLRQPKETGSESRRRLVDSLKTELRISSQEKTPLIQHSKEVTEHVEGSKMIEGPEPTLPTEKEVDLPSVNEPKESLFIESETPSSTEATKPESWFRPSRLMAAAFLILLTFVCWKNSDSLLAYARQQLDQFNQPQFRVKRSAELTTATIPVSALRVKQLDHTELPRRFTGILKPHKASEIGFNRVGTMDEILVDRGQRIEKNQVIAKLNVASLQANVKALNAQYKAANARLEEMIAGPRAQTIDAARNQVDAAKAELELAKTSLGRAERLVGVGAVSKQDVDAAATAVKAKQESLKAAQNALDELQAGTRDEQLRAQRAVLNELEAAQEQLKVQLDESVIRAPFKAIVSERFLDPGSVCSPGVPVVRLVAVGAPEAWIGLPPEFVSSLVSERQYDLAVGKKSIPAKYKSILPELDSGTRTTTVVFELVDAETESLLGQVAEIELSKPIQEAGFWLPMSAIIKGDQGLWAVLAFDESDSQQSKLVKRELEVIHVEAERAYVRGTLKDGDLVVSTGLHRLTPGQLVSLADQQDDKQADKLDRSSLR